MVVMSKLPGTSGRLVGHGLRGELGLVAEARYGACREPREEVGRAHVEPAEVGGAQELGTVRDDSG